LTDTGIQMKERIPMEAKRKYIIYKEEFRRQAVEMVIHSGKTQAQERTLNTFPCPFFRGNYNNGNKTSTLSLPLRISLSDLNSRLNTFVPHSFQGDAPINIPGANSGSHATFTVTSAVSLILV
jgi:hypothetical protein